MLGHSLCVCVCPCVRACAWVLGHSLCVCVLCVRGCQVLALWCVFLEKPAGPLLCVSVRACACVCVSLCCEKARCNSALRRVRMSTRAKVQAASARATPWSASQRHTLECYTAPHPGVLHSGAAMTLACNLQPSGMDGDRSLRGWNESSWHLLEAHSCTSVSQHEPCHRQGAAILMSSARAACAPAWACMMWSGGARSSALTSVSAHGGSRQCQRAWGLSRSRLPRAGPAFLFGHA